MSSRIFRILLLALAAWLFCDVACAQDTTRQKYPKVLIYQGDTLMAFTIPMAYDIAQKRDSLKIYKKLYDNSEAKVDTLQAKIKKHEEIHENDSTQLALQTQLTTAANKETAIIRDERDYYKKKHKRQKIGFWAVVGGGVAGWVAFIFK